MSISSTASAWASMLAQRCLDVRQLALDGEGEGGDRALHPFQDVHPQQVDQALFAVHLPEECSRRPGSAVLYFAS